MNKIPWAILIVFYLYITFPGLNQLAFASEDAGMQAEQAGNFDRALTLYVEALKTDPDNRQLREKIVHLAQQLQPPPALPEEANRHMVRGEAFAELAGDKSGFIKAAAEFQKAANAAPWLARAYFNMGIAQAEAEQFSQAIKSLEFYLFVAPYASDVQDVRNMIYKIEVRQETASAPKVVAEKIGPTIQDFAGRWKNNIPPTSWQLMDLIPQKNGNVVKVAFKLGPYVQEWDDSKQKLVNVPGDWADPSYLQYEFRGDTLVIYKYHDNGCGSSNKTIREITLRGPLEADAEFKYTIGSLPGRAPDCKQLVKHERWFRP